MNNASLELGGTNWAEKDASLLGYTVSDDSGRFFPQEFTFSRGSNLAATRIGKTGLIEKGRENLLLQSNQFDTTWVLTNAPTLASGQAGYDGSNDAWKLEASTTGSSRSIHQVVSSSGVQVFSVYVKAGTTDWIRLNLSGIGNRYFDIGNGVVGGSGSINGFITDVGGGWYRCSVLGNGSSTAPYVFLASDNGNLSVNAGDNIYIQDAQLEQGLAASPYIPTTTTTAQAGVLENTPRLNYTTGVANPYLLLEPSRTNLVPISEGIPEDFSNVTLTENYGTSPEGVQNSLKVQKSGVDGNDRIYLIDNFNATLVSGRKYAISAFVKNIDVTGVTTIACRVSGGALFRQPYQWTGASLATSTYNQGGTRTNTILEDYGNGWWRIGFSFEANGTSASFELDIDRDNGSDTTSIEIWGWQFESATGDASYPTSYIPNHSGTGSVTRGVDVPSNASATSVIGQTEGTIFIDFLYESNQSGNRFSISDGAPSNWIFIATPESGTSSRFYIRVNNAVIVDVGASSYFVDGQRYKLALAYKSGDWAVYGNGTQLYVGTNNIPSFSSPMDTINFKSYSAGDSITEREKINQVLLFDTRLSNTDLATLTTI
jgi:hypothetical protein